MEYIKLYEICIDVLMHSSSIGLTLTEILRNKCGIFGRSLISR